MKKPGKQSKTPPRSASRRSEAESKRLNERDIPKAMEAAMQRAVRKALLIHKKLGNPIAVWENGKVAWIPPEKIQVDDD